MCFVRVANLAAFELANPIGLQLGCVGSRSKVNFGLRTDVSIGPTVVDTYFDVVNIDHYEVILGCPFMIMNNVSMDFGAGTVRFGAGNPVPAHRGEGSGKNTTKPARPGNPKSVKPVAGKKATTSRLTPTRSD